MSCVCVCMYVCCVVFAKFQKRKTKNKYTRKQTKREKVKKERKREGGREREGEKKVFSEYFIHWKKRGEVPLSHFFLFVKIQAGEKRKIEKATNKIFK